MKSTNAKSEITEIQMMCRILKSHRIESTEHDKKGEDGGIRLKLQGSVKERWKWKKSPEDSTVRALNFPRRDV